MLCLQKVKTVTLWIVLAVNIIGSAPVLAVSIGDIPAEFRQGFDPDRLAFAYYDYRLTTGFEGQFTSFTEGPLSLFDETQGGILSLSADFSWVAGQGWVASGSDATFHWKNVRVPTNDKFFAQAITLGANTQVTSVTITTDNPGDQVPDLVWNVFNEASNPPIDINGDGDKNDNVLVINARIHPQPNDVFVKVVFQGTSFEQGWILDQCKPVPEPSSLLLLGVGLLGLLGYGWRRRKQAARQT